MGCCVSIKTAAVDDDALQQGRVVGDESMSNEQAWSWTRRRLQIAVAIAGLVPVVGGLAGVAFGAAAFGGPTVATEITSITLDSHVRYLSGLLLGIGLTFWWLIPTIEQRTRLVRVLTAIVVIGGLGRLLGLALNGQPSRVMMFALVMELMVTPLLCVWQARVARG